MRNNNIEVYQFRMWGRIFAVDVISGNFFEIDRVTSYAIALMRHSTLERIRQRISREYGVAAANKVDKDLSFFNKRESFSRTCYEAVNSARRITDLTLNITGSCNLNCRYCWNERGGYGGSRSDNKIMDDYTAFKAIDLLLTESHGAKDLVVDFYGGEPLLNFGLIRDVIGYCKRIKLNKRINFHFLLATNGTLLTKEKGKFLIENGVDIAVSIDGWRKIQDMQRPFPDGSGSFDRIQANINSLERKYREKIVGRATFTPYSTKLVRTFKFLRRMGFERIELCESEKAGYGLRSKSAFFFDAEDTHHLKKLYRGLAVFYASEIKNGNLTYKNTYFNRFFKQLSRLYHIQSVAGICSAGSSLMAVDCDGSIYPCTAFIGIKKYSVGNVDSGIYENKIKTFLDVRICSGAICDRCWARRICMGCGSCYNLNYFANNNLAQPDPYYCELFRYKTKLMIAMIAEISDKNLGLLDKILIPEYYSARGKRRK